MLINLMDPALRISAGHHLDLDIGVARELARAGHDVRIYSHVDISPEARQAAAAHAELTPAFRISPYLDPANASAAPDALAAFTRTAAVLADDLRRVRSADRWIWPSLFSAQHNACVIADPGTANAGCICVEPAYLNPSGADLWRHTLTQARKRGTKFALGVLEPLLRDEYQPLTSDACVKTYPAPYDRIREPAPRHALSTIGFFGNQRDEKGVALFGELIAKLLDHGFNIVLHDSSGGSAGTGNKRVRLVLGFVPDLAAEIAACDLVVMPYRPDQYRFKGSGILWSALANGVPLVAPGGTAPGRWIESSGAGKLFTAFTVGAVLQSILDARSDYANIARAAQAVSAGWPARHGIRKFAEVMLQD